jgi:lipid-binding SYLF domain-containing protein
MSKMPLFVTAVAVFSCAFGSAQEQSRREERALAKADEIARERQEILSTAESTMSRLREEVKESGKLIDEAYGYAVFATTNAAFIISGSGGKGVAQRQGGQQPVFMRMSSIGIGLGAGAENYNLVILFEDAATYERFIEGQWGFKGKAQSAAGDVGAVAAPAFQDGVALYHLTDKGLIANIDVSSIRFSRDGDLNASG